MSIRVEPFGTLPTGESVERYILTGKGGLTASLLTYGATLHQLVLDGYDVVRGYDDLAGYLTGGSYQGATIGRYGNRIADGRFSLNGTAFDVGRNENGVGHLHGGAAGFDRRLWHATVRSEGREPSVVFARLSPNGEEGYPGNLAVSVCFTVEATNTLRIEYEAHTDADTVLNLTNHAYFHLDDHADVCNTLLWIDADAFTPVDERLIPTGEMREVTGTAFDFRTPKPIGQDIHRPDDQLRLGSGYDHNFVLNGEGLRHVMTACSVESGRRLTCCTDQPAAQFYAAGMLDEPHGKGGRPLTPRSAFCFETQHCPDSPNQPRFPSTRLAAGDTFRSVTTYHLETMDDLL